MKKHLYTCLLLLPMLGSARAQGSLEAPRPSANTIAVSAAAKVPETSLSQVQERLKLTDSQRALWAEYVARIDAYSLVYYSERPASAFAGDAAPRQIGRLSDNLQNRLAALDEVESAAKALYAALDTSQRQTADQLLLATVPVFASSAAGACPPMGEGKPRSDRPEAGQHKRRSGGGMGG